MPFGFRPEFDGMIGQCDVTAFAGIKLPTTFHLNGDDVRRAVIVSAASFAVQVDSMYDWIHFFLVRGQRTSMVVLRPPRGVNSPRTTHHSG